MELNELRIRSVVIPAAELEWRFSRSSGPGGQSVNTSDSRVELRFDLATSPSVPESLRQRALDRLERRLVGGCVVVVASEHRSQLRNREAAISRLATILDAAFAPNPRRRRPTAVPKAATERRLEGKRRRSLIKRGRSGAGSEAGS